MEHIRRFFFKTTRDLGMGGLNEAELRDEFAHPAVDSRNLPVTFARALARLIDRNNHHPNHGHRRKKFLP